jgi:hypothetical protein
MPLPAIATECAVTPEARLTPVLRTSRIELGQWLQGVFSPGWQALDELFNRQVCLALSPRSQGKGAKRGKLIDLSVKLPGASMVLLLNITEEADEKLSVLVQLHPAGEERYLPPQVTLTLLSPSGEKLQEVHSRTQDNYIQLKSFKGRAGMPFRIALGFGSFTLCENFKL